VDGPPQQVFDKLVRALEAESTARSFTIVSREAQASYRVRSYLSAQVRRGGKTTIAWVWDVYDRDQERALRLSGEEPAGKGRDAWAMADEQMMRRIALAGLNGLNGLISGSSAPESPAGRAAIRPRHRANGRESAGIGAGTNANTGIQRPLGRSCHGPLVFAGKPEALYCQPRHLLVITPACKDLRLWFRFIGSDMLKSVSPTSKGEAAISAKNGSIKLVAGNSNPELAAAISSVLNLPLTKASVAASPTTRFSSKFSRTSAARTCTSFSRRRFRPTTT
jgi:hypothetical protein